MARRDHDDLLSLFGSTVRERRTKLGWSQQRLAEESGMHFTYVGSIERGERNVSLVNIVRLAQALNTDPGNLVRGLEL